MIRLLFFIFILFGCSSTLPDDSLSLSEHLKLGMDLLDEEKFVKAQDQFKYVLSRGAGTDYGDDAQFFLAESYFLNSQYIESIPEYENLIRKMAYSPFFEKSRFRVCEAYRFESPDYFNDQTYTEKALERYQEFLDDFPNSDLNKTVNISMSDLRNKLAKKLYETGILYMKMEEYKPARMAFNKILDIYYDTVTIELAHFEIIKSFIMEKNIIKANQHWDNLDKNNIKDISIANEIDKMLLSYTE